MSGHLFGSRSDNKRDAWKQRCADWQRNNPAPTNDEDTDE